MDNDINEVKKTLLKKFTEWCVENFKLVLSFVLGFVIGGLFML